MTNGWQTVSLGEFLTQRKEFFIIDDFSKYKRARVQSHGKGIVLRDEVDGIEIKTKKQQAARTGEFLVAEIDAKVGGFGIVPSELDGAVVSSHYFLFQIDEQKCSKEWLNWFVRYNSLEEQVKAQGSTNYAAIRPSDVLSYKIPLPLIDEQYRILERVTSLSVRISKAKSLREKADAETDAILSSTLFHIFDINNQHWKSMPMPEAVEINDSQVDPTLPEYSNLPHISGENMESKTCRLLPYRTAEVDGVKSSNYLFSPNTILYSKIRPYLRKAVYVDFQGVCSADVYPIKVNNPELDIKFVMWSLVANPFSEYANTLSGRTRMPKLNRNQLFAFTFKYPPLDEQRRIVAYLDSVQARLASLRELQSATGEELSALLPSVLDRAFKGEL
jgi:type I restriction enzyme S subunit